MKTNVHLWKYLAQLYLKCEMFQDKCYRENQNTFYVQYFQKSCRLRVKVEEYDTTSQATDNNIIRGMPDN
jgi:hypothetical protein